MLYRRSVALCCVFTLLALSYAAGSPGTYCNRKPIGHSTPKTPGDNGFKIKLSGNPDKYTPGEVYTVSLQGWTTKYTKQKFTEFLLVAMPSNSDHINAVQTAGTFQLLGDALTKFSDDCPHAVTQTTPIPKSDIQVEWTAPPTGSGCVKFRATVVEFRDVWYMDDGELTVELCERAVADAYSQPSPTEECCACDEAKYEITFKGLWSRQTHPKDFPTNEWLTHFSDVIGASHNAKFRMWDFGGYASDGLKQVAEWGSTRKMEAELKTKSADIRTIIKARGLWFPHVNGETFAVFRVDKNYHLVSLVSMLGPSPDWCVGISALDLCLKNCTWIGQKVIDLYPWDAGTDSGITYMSANAPTNPQDKIQPITSTSPKNPQSPFYNVIGEPIPPVARLTITRERIYEKSCDEAESSLSSTTETSTIEEPESKDRPECAVGEWTPFSSCSVTCGKGLRMRTRNYVNKMKADMMGCDLQMVEKEMCPAVLPECPDESENDPKCATTDWLPWSECSVTCGEGMRTRSRDYLEPMAFKMCNKELMQKDKCMGVEQECEVIEPKCNVTKWSLWSPCSVTCGKGFRERIRFYFNPAAKDMCNVNTRQVEMCMAPKTDCSIDFSESKVICSMPKEVGLCRGYNPRWYFEPEKGMCLQFIYSGCRGNKNNFVKYEDCNRMCEMTQAPITPKPNTTPPTLANDGNPAIDCMVSEWTPWSECSRTCGRGRQERQRMIKVPAQNGGEPCPKKVSQKRKCRLRFCPVDCLLGAWGEWTKCSQSCGEGAVQQRTRVEVRKERHGGAACGSKLEQRYCSLPACPYR